MEIKYDPYEYSTPGNVCEHLKVMILLFAIFFCAQNHLCYMAPYQSSVSMQKLKLFQTCAPSAFFRICYGI